MTMDDLLSIVAELEQRITELELDRMADHDRRIKRLEGAMPPLPPYEELATWQPWQAPSPATD